MVALVVEIVAEMDLNLLKEVEKKAQRKRIAEPMHGWSTRIKIRHPPTLSIPGPEGPEPPRAGNFRVMRIQSGSTSPVSDGNQRSQTSRATEEAVFSLLVLEETISSLLAPPIITFSLEDEPANEAETSGAMPATLKLETSALEDNQVAHKLFIRMLLPVDTTKLPIEPRRVLRTKAVESFIRVS